MKILTLDELRQIVVEALTGDTLDNEDDWTTFLDDLSTVVTRYFGGISCGARRGVGDFMRVGIELDDRVPDDGGVYQHVAKDVLWKDGCEWVRADATIEQPEDVSDRLYIINNVDRPCPEHIVYRRKDGIWGYVDRELNERGYLFGTRLPEEATSLSVFGLQALRYGQRVEVSRVGPSLATYADGTYRKWQDVHDFELELPEDSDLC